MPAMRALAIVLVLTATAAAQGPAAPTPPTTTAPTTTTSPATSTSDEALRRELDELHARQRELERRLEARERRDARHEVVVPPPPVLLPSLPPPPPPDATIPRLRFGRGGFILSTADGRSNIRFRAVFNLDGHAYFGGAHPAPDTFLIRRARPFIDGTLFDVIDFRLMPDFAQGQAQLLDAYVELHPFPWLRLRGGRFMIPVGLEWMQKDTTTSFVERSLVTDLVPWRDLGVMLSGEVADATLLYQLAIVNGGPDGANGPDLDPQTAKDYVGRLFLRPLRRVRRASCVDLGFGVAGSYGWTKGTATAPGLASYKTPGQQPMFSYVTAPAGKTTLAAAMPGAASDGPAMAAGDRWRLTPQMYLYAGPFGLLGEYIVSSQHVARGGTAADVANRAWNLTASFVMTLERATFDGVTPKHPVDFRHANFGAFEIVLRYSELRFDPTAFPLFADPTTSVSSARELAGGINWYLMDYVKLMISYHRTTFEGGAGMGDREPENAIMGRLQLAL